MKRILLVEDDEVDRMRVRRFLRGTELELVEATDLASAAAALETGRFDCVLCDLSLPDGDGFELVERLQGHAVHAPPVVVLTGTPEGERAVSALRLGAQDYLEKDELSAHRLQRSIAHATERQRNADLQRRLLEYDRVSALGRIAGGMAHQINNPAAAVQGNSEVLLDLARQLGEAAEATGASGLRASLAEVMEIAQDNLAACRRITQVVDEVIRYASNEQAEHAPIRVEKVAATVRDLARARLGPAGEITLAVEPDVHVHGSVSQVLHAVLHLVENAVEAVLRAPGRRHRIEVSARRVGETVELAVRDSGPGIPAESLDRVFDPFYTLRPASDGLGLGLAVVADVARLHGGRVEVDSPPTGGARFTLRLPAADPPQQTPAETARVTVKPRLLLVGDDCTVLRELSHQLAPHFLVRTASSGAQALEQLGCGRFEAVVCDARLADLPPVAFERGVRTVAPHLSDQIYFTVASLDSPAACAVAGRASGRVLERPLDAAALLRQVFVDRCDW